ncbi:MAG TPA: hypothetical protein VG733_02560 [Chthoniobacteraceae bacterium]|nr:hypothetical protein [Chthoniobacteraceae bacterium]
MRGAVIAPTARDDIKPSTKETSIKTKPLFTIVKSTLAVIALACAFVSTGGRAAAGDMTTSGTGADAKGTTAPATPSEEPKIHFLLQNEFSDKYITPRGLIVEDKGVVWQPLGVMLIDLYSKDSGFLTDVTLAPANWASVHSHRAGPQNRNWNEDDPSIALNLTFYKDLELDSTYTAFVSENGAYPTSTNLDEKLTYHDNFIPGGFSINPYVEYFDELTNKATFNLVPATSKRGYYFVLGVDPKYTVKTAWEPITFELPTFVSVVSDHFYQRKDGSPGGSGVGVFSSEFKASIPLDFVPKGYGHWTAYAGFQYYYIANHGALDGNSVFGASAPDRNHDLYQFHTGIQIFF